MIGLDPRALRHLQDLDRRHLWHPFTQMADWEAKPPLVIVEGHGVYLVDAEGREYIDGVSSLWCNVHGHRRPEIDQAVRDQLGRIAHSTLLGLAGPPSIELAEKLFAVAPRNLTRVFFSDDGSTAVEVALKMAFQYWRQHPDGPQNRPLFVSLGQAYHGDTLGSVSVGGIDLFHEAYRPLLFETLKAPCPHCYRCELGLEPATCGMRCAEELGSLLEAHRGQVAAVIVEPLVQGAAGMLVQPEGYLRRVADLCRQHDVLFIADEVATGFGRTGTMFACQQEGIEPDLMAVAKGLSGGYLPLAATLTTEEIYRAFFAVVVGRGPVPRRTLPLPLGEGRGEGATVSLPLPPSRREGEPGGPQVAALHLPAAPEGRPESPNPEPRTFFHGHTFTGNALACAAALANLEIFEAERTLEQLPPKIERLRTHLEALRDLPHVGDVRQKGLMAGIELVADKPTKTPYPPDLRMGARVCARIRDCGVILRPLGDVIVIMPPLIISLEELDRMMEAVAEAVRELAGEQLAPRLRSGP